VGLIEKIKNFFKKSEDKQAITSDYKRLQALESDYKRFEALQSAQEDSLLSHPPDTRIEVEKNSLQLGVAAGYTAHTIRDIEFSLNRIESTMLTREWFTSKFDEKMTELINSIKEHEQNEQKRFEIIQSFIHSMYGIASKSPEPIKSEILDKIHLVESQLPLTFKMRQIIEIVKEEGEISYEELSKRLGITVSAIRGILSTMQKRTNEIERFEKDRKGWVRYTGKRLQAIQSDSNLEINENFVDK